jgi:hypothetical protein
VKKVSLIEVIREFRTLTLMIKKAEIYNHDDIDVEVWGKRMDRIEKKSRTILRSINK